MKFSNTLPALAVIAASAFAGHLAVGALNAHAMQDGQIEKLDQQTPDVLKTAWRIGGGSASMGLFTLDRTQEFVNRETGQTCTYEAQANFLFGKTFNEKITKTCQPK